MKHRKRNAFRLALASVLFACAGAQAADINTPSVTSKSFDVKIFAPLPSVAISLVPSEYLQSGHTPANTTLANAVVTITEPLDSNHQRVVIRWTPAQTDVLTNEHAILHGSSDSNNAIDAIIVAQTSNLQALEDGWLTFTTANLAQGVSVKSFKDQVVKPDTYKIYLDAGVFAF